MKKRIRSTLIFTSLIISGCSFNKTIEAGDSVHIIFTGTFEDQNIFETKDMIVVVGSGEVISGIDSALIGMKEGETKTITLNPENAYGKQYQKDKVQKIYKVIADKMPSLQASGEKTLGGLTWSLRGTETDENGNAIIIFDLNSPETWKTLVYTIKVKEIEKQ